MSGRPGKVVLALSSIIAILLAECSDNGLFFNVTKQHKPTVNVFFQSKKNKELLKTIVWPALAKENKNSN